MKWIVILHVVTWLRTGPPKADFRGRVGTLFAWYSGRPGFKSGSTELLYLQDFNGILITKNQQDALISLIYFYFGIKIHSNIYIYIYIYVIRVMLTIC